LAGGTFHSVIAGIEKLLASTPGLPVGNPSKSELSPAGKMKSATRENSRRLQLCGFDFDSRKAKRTQGNSQAV
jgi:hypothetical protein